MWYVTNCECISGVYYDKVFFSIAEAQEVSAKINRMARMGICEFSEVIPIN